jgi:plastocyanin
MKALAVAAVAVALLAGCGGGSPSKPAGAIQVTMTEFKFDPLSLSAPHGKVVFYLVNAGTQAHDMVIRDSSSNRVNGSDLISAGDSSVFTVDSINAGTYTIVCTQPGHESSGMKGTLTIT